MPTTPWVLLTLCLTALSSLHCAPPQPETIPVSTGAWALLAKADLETLEVDSKEISIYDQKNHGRFSQIFGGTSSDDVRKFLNARIKYIFQSSDLVTYSPERIHSGWTEMATDPDEAGLEESADGNTIAANVGAELWLQGLFDGREISVHFQDGTILPIQSPQVGFLFIEKLYAQLPRILRQSSLAHEARHSDCSEEIDAEDIRVGQTATSYQEFRSRFRATQCVHQHIICTQGDYQGQAACDDQPWGAYGVQAVFLDATSKSKKLSFHEQQMAQIALIDTKSRLTFHFEPMLKGKLGEPNFSVHAQYPNR